MLCSVSCSTEVSRRGKRLSYYSVSVFCVLHTQTFRLCYGTLCAPSTGNPGGGGEVHRCGCCCGLDQSPRLFGLNRQEYRQDQGFSEQIPCEQVACKSQGFVIWIQLLDLQFTLQHRNSHWKLEGKRVKEPSLSPYANMQEILGQEQ